MIRPMVLHILPIFSILTNHAVFLENSSHVMQNDIVIFLTE